MWISSLCTRLWFFARNLNELNPKFTQFAFDTLAKMLNFALVLPCKCAIIASKMLNAFCSPLPNRLNVFPLGVVTHRIKFEFMNCLAIFSFLLNGLQRGTLVLGFVVYLTKQRKSTLQKAAQNLQQSYKIHSKTAKFNSSQIHRKL